MLSLEVLLAIMALREAGCADKSTFIIVISSSTLLHPHVGPSNYKWKESVCHSIISTTIHPIDFTLGRCIAEDPRKCSFKCEDVWVRGSWETCKQQYWRSSNRPVPNRHVFEQTLHYFWQTQDQALFKPTGPLFKSALKSKFFQRHQCQTDHWVHVHLRCSVPVGPLFGKHIYLLAFVHERALSFSSLEENCLHSHPHLLPSDCSPWLRRTSSSTSLVSSHRREHRDGNVCLSMCVCLNH